MGRWVSLFLERFEVPEGFRDAACEGVARHRRLSAGWSICRRSHSRPSRRLGDLHSLGSSGGEGDWCAASFTRREVDFWGTWAGCLSAKGGGDGRGLDSPGRSGPLVLSSAAKGRPVERARGPTMAASASRLAPRQSSRVLVPPPAYAPAAAAIAKTTIFVAIRATHSATVLWR